ncbi:MAG: four helix bundle protein [Candidatus Gracilibacteria bacterium]
MDKNELKDRTKQFALRVIKLVEKLPKTVTGYVLGKQLIRSGTSVAANYRATCLARSKAEFISRLGVVAEEADETVLWLELISEGGVMKANLLTPLLQEAKELTAIMCASRKSASKK